MGKVTIFTNLINIELLGSMKVLVTRKHEMQTTRWSGGTTTQLAIYPPGASLAERNFLFRISTATVEAESSTFTKLPGVRRVLMILEGSLEVEHVGHYSKILSASETDSFPGNWETKSRGKVRDFNLMTMGNAEGTVEMDTIRAEDMITIHEDRSTKVIGIFVPVNDVSYKAGEFSGVLNKEDFLLALFEKDEAIELRSSVETGIVLVKISGEF
jgi:uncharacterized protein